VLADHVLRDAVFARRAGAEKGERVAQEVAKPHAAILDSVRSQC